MWLSPLYSGDMTSPRQLNNGVFSLVVILVICSTSLHLPTHHTINGIFVRQNVGINKLSAMAYLAFYKKWHEAYLRSNSFTTCPAASYDHGAAKVLILTKLQCNVLAPEWSRPALRGIMRLVTECQGCHHVTGTHLTPPATETGVVLQSSCARVNWKISILDTCLKYVGGDILWFADG